MKTSAKYTIAAIISFILCTVVPAVVWSQNAEAATIALLASLFLAVIYTVPCIIFSVRHKKKRRYLISLTMIMACNAFAVLYLALDTLLRGHEGFAYISVPIYEIAYLGGDVLLAALCARIWYEEIEKSAAVDRRKITAVSIASVLFVLAVGAVSLLAGQLSLLTILYLVTAAAILCYSLRFFTLPSAAKPFLPLAVIATAYAVYSAAYSFIIPLFPGADTEIISTFSLLPTVLSQMLLLPALLYAEELMEKIRMQNTAAGNEAFVNAAAEKSAALTGTALTDIGEMTPVSVRENSAALEYPALRDNAAGLWRNICRVLLFFIIGMIACYLAGYLNTFIVEAFGATTIELGLYISPVAEECLKAIPILIFFLAVRPGLKTLLLPAIACGAGFGVLETIFYAMGGGFAPAEIVLRLLSTGLMHAITAAFFAASLWYVTQKGLTCSRVISILSGFGVAAGGITCHGCFNLLINSSGAIHYVGYVLPVLAAAAFTALYIIWDKNTKKTVV